MTSDKSINSEVMEICGFIELVGGATPSVLWSSLPFSKWNLLTLLPWGNWLGGSIRYVTLPGKGKFMAFWSRTKAHGLGVVVRSERVTSCFSLMAQEILEELSWWADAISEISRHRDVKNEPSFHWEDMMQDFHEIFRTHLEGEKDLGLRLETKEILELFPPLSWGTILFLLLISGKSQLNFQVFLNGTHEKILSLLELLFTFLPTHFVMNSLSFVSMSGSITYFTQKMWEFDSESVNVECSVEPLALIGVERFPSEENLTYLQAMALNLDQGEIKPGILIDHPLIRHAEYLMKTEPLALRHWLTHEVLPLGERAIYEDIFARFFGDDVML